MKRYKSLSVLLILALLFSQSALAFASATDVANGHWAKKTIDSVLEDELMALFDGGAFMPTRAVSHVEAIVVIYRAAAKANLLGDLSIPKITEFYEKELTGMGIPKVLSPYGADVYPAMAYAIENGIITPEEAKTFVKDNALTTINKTTAAVFFGRALNVFKQENLNKIIVLEYKDEASIPLHARRFIQFLIDYEILSPKGDNLGNFNPADPMNRTLLAVILEKYFAVLTAMTPELETPEEPSEKPELETPLPVTERVLKGTVVSVNDAQKNFAFQTSDGKAETLGFKHAVISSGQVVLGTQGLYAGAEVTVTERHGIVMAIQVAEEGLAKVLQGQLTLVGAEVTVAPAFRSLRITSEDKKHEHRRLYGGTPIVINGKSVSVTDLLIGDRLWVQYEEQSIKRIIGFSGEYETTGVLLEDYKEKQVKLLSKEGYVYDIPVGANVSLINQTAGFGADTIVKVRIQDGVVTRMEPIGKQMTIEGKLLGIHIKEKPEITLLVDGKTVTHALTDAVLFADESDKPTLSIYDLRLDQLVSVRLGIGGADYVKLGHSKPPVATEKTYTIKAIFETAGLLTVTESGGALKTVVLGKNAAVQLSAFKVGDLVTIDGKALTEGVIEAEKISLVK